MLRQTISISRTKLFHLVARPPQQQIRHARTVPVIVVGEDTPKNVGNLYETVSVKAGYMRNFLFPNGMCVYATKAEHAKYEPLKKIHDKNLEELKLVAEAAEIERQTAEAERLAASNLANTTLEESKILQASVNAEQEKQNKLALEQSEKADEALVTFSREYNSDPNRNPIELSAAANDNGKLYAALSKTNIAKAFSHSLGVDIEPDQILLTEQNNIVGKQKCQFRLNNGKEVTVGFTVTSEVK